MSAYGSRTVHYRPRGETASARARQRQKNVQQSRTCSAACRFASAITANLILIFALEIASFGLETPRFPFFLFREPVRACVRERSAHALSVADRSSAQHECEQVKRVSCATAHERRHGTARYLHRQHVILISMCTIVYSLPLRGTPTITNGTLTHSIEHHFGRIPS